MEWDGIFLGHLPDGRFCDALERAAVQRGWYVRRTSTAEIRRISRAAWEARLKPALDSSAMMRRQRSRLAAEGAIELEYVTEPAPVRRALSSFIRLHQESWAARGRVSPFEEPLRRRLIEEAIDRSTGRRQVVVSSLRVGGADVAMRLSFLFNGMAHLYAAAYNPRYARTSPGVLQLASLLEQLFATGTETVDLGFGDSPHKARFVGDRVCPIRNVVIYKRRQRYVEARLLARCRAWADKHPRMLALGRSAKRFAFGPEENAGE